ncbi:unnamed protein product, partial [Ilex paraguariensis]
GIGEKTIKGYAHRTVNNGHKVKYKSNFVITQDFEEIGGILVQNEHHKEMYLTNIVLDGFLHGTVTLPVIHGFMQSLMILTKEFSSPTRQAAGRRQRVGLLETPKRETSMREGLASLAAAPWAQVSTEKALLKGGLGAFLSYLDAVSGRSGAISGCSGVVSGQLGAVSGSWGVVSGHLDAVPSHLGTIPGGSSAFSGSWSAVLGGLGAKPGALGAIPCGSGTVLSHSGAILGSWGAILGGSWCCLGLLEQRLGLLWCYPGSFGHRPRWLGRCLGSLGHRPWVACAPPWVALVPSRVAWASSWVTWRHLGSLGCRPGLLGRHLRSLRSYLWSLGRHLRSLG